MNYAFDNILFLIIPVSLATALAMAFMENLGWHAGW